MQTHLTKPGCRATQRLCRTAVQPIGVQSLSRRRKVAVSALFDPSDLLQHAQAIVHHMPLAYEPVAAPCSLMNCGDVVHRSTLDPVLRKEVQGVDWKVFALAALASLYLFATPGVLPGAIDYYITGPLQRKRAQAISKSDLKLGKLLGSGGFGSVYKAVLTNEDGSTSNVIVKKAKEFGEAEVWMNERMSRINPLACAEFKGAFLDTGSGPVGPAGAAAGLGGNCVWLVWMDEGDNTLYDLMTKRDFPYNLEPILLERELRLPKDKRRRLVTFKLVITQLLESLEAAHATGIVHRDVKPQNAILSVRDKRLKLIDWGAAADLRLGINYVPNEYLLDPRYAPPQQYVMSRQTATPPPKPVAALLSPVLWQMEHPDKFDMYSVGVLFLQMAFPNLRSDNSLIAFNRRLQELGWDLRAWKREVMAKHPRGLPKEFEEGFEVLEAEEGAAWDLICKLVSYNPTERPTASEALVHPFLSSGSLVTSPGTPSGTGTVLAAAPAAATAAVRSVSASVGNTVNTVGKKVTEMVPAGLLEEAFIHSDQQGLTEAWLAEEFGYDKRTPQALAQQRETIAWFMGRQGDLQRKIAARQARFAANVNRTIRGVAKRLRAQDSSSKPGSPVAGRPGSPGSPGSSSRPGSAEIRKGKGAAAAAARVNGNGKAKAAAGVGGFGGLLLPLGLVRGLEQQPEQQEEVVVPTANGNGNGNGKGAKKEERAVGKVKELINVFGRR